MRYTRHDAVVSEGCDREKVSPTGTYVFSHFAGNVESTDCLTLCGRGKITNNIIIPRCKFIVIILSITSI